MSSQSRVGHFIESQLSVHTNYKAWRERASERDSFTYQFIETTDHNITEILARMGMDEGIAGDVMMEVVDGAAWPTASPPRRRSLSPTEKRTTAAACDPVRRPPGSNQDDGEQIQGGARGGLHIALLVTGGGACTCTAETKILAPTAPP